MTQITLSLGSLLGLPVEVSKEIAVQQKHKNNNHKGFMASNWLFG